MLRRRVAVGVAWNFAEQLSRRGIGIVFTLLLGRFLLPEDFGLIAMMAVFMAIASKLMESGFKEALIRMKGATQRDYSTAFFANISLGILAYLLLFFSAPYVAEFYSEEKLIELIRVAGIAIIINSLQLVQIVILSRDLNFKKQLTVTVPATIVSGIVAVLLAYLGFGVWALIAQMLVSSMIVCVFYWNLNLWRPVWTFSLYSLKNMYSFGLYLFITGLFNTLFKNMYVVVIAKIFSAKIAGLYFFAEKITDLIISQLVTSIQTVTYPALASIQDHDVRLKEGYRHVIKTSTFFLFPAMTLLAALAEPLFNTLLPEKWLSAVPYLQLMCISSLLYPLHSINLNILKVKGRSDLVFRLMIIKKITLVSVFYMSYRFGVIGIILGQILSSFLSYLPNAYYSKKMIGYSVFEQMQDLFSGFLLSSIVAGLIYLLVYVSTLSSSIELMLFGFIGVFSYVALAYVFKFEAIVLAENYIKNR